MKIEVEVRIWVARVVGFCCGLCCGFFFFFFGGWGLRLWLVMVAMAMVVVRGDELEKLRPRRFCEQISKRARSFSVCDVGFFFFLNFGC